MSGMTAVKAGAKTRAADLATLEVASATEWHEWLAVNYESSPGVWLRIPKKGPGARRARGAMSAISYAEALDAALVWGWIDSQKRPLDDIAWLQRFTRRAARSPWSKINCMKAEALLSKGALAPPGLAEVIRAKQDGRWERAYDGARTAQVPADLSAALAGLPGALAFFEDLDSANRFAILYGLHSAKKASTRDSRLARFVEMCARGETLHPRRRA